MQTINILNEHIANQIAAGEVVERPVSVVKELVENSIDANSTKITVDIINGGLELIKVMDNGDGMSSIDTSIAFERHATSKILTEKSLFKIQTLGFRGEALPSIAAISKLEIKTKRRVEELGNFLRIEGGKKGQVEPAGCPDGTQIIIRDLFFNTPARLKYLKSIATETNHINEYITRMAMAYPNISFAFSHNNKEIFMTPGNGRLEDVLLTIYGRQTKHFWLPIMNENLDFQIDGFIAKPEFNRSTRQHMSFFVNGRYIRNARLSEAVIKGYHTLLPINKYPIASIHITMDFSLVDVNVHPSKLEVRFSKENELYQLLLKCIQHKLGESDLIPEILAQSFKKSTYVKPISNDIGNSNRSGYSIIDNDNKNNSENKNENKNYNDSKIFNDSKYNGQLYKSNSGNTSRADLTEKVMRVFEPIDNSINKIQKPASSIYIASTEKEDILQDTQQDTQEETLQELLVETLQESEQENCIIPRSKLDCRVLGQIHGTYIIAEDEKGLLLIDQHAAHERINYEKNIHTIKNQKTKKQMLLIPIQLTYTPAELDVIKEMNHLFESFGIEYDPFGEKTLLIRSYPDWIPEDKVYEFSTYFIDMVLNHRSQINIVDLLEEACISFSCKASIKGNQYLSKEEIEQLLIDLNQTETPYTCPHGRPIIIHYSKYELEKLFKRKT